MSGRNALLEQIQKGKKLNKAQTNDRSAPIVGGSNSGGGSGVPATGGGMGMARPPMPPIGSMSNNGGTSVEQQGPPPGIPGLGGLFTGGMPKLKHRSGGVNTGRAAGGGAAPPHSSPPAPPPPPPPPQQQQQQQRQQQPEQPSSQKPSGGSRFSLPFRRNSHGRSASQSDASGAKDQSKPAPKAPPPPPRTQVVSGAPVIPARRQSDADSNADASMPKYPPSIPPISSPPSRPESSVSGKKAPPRPTSRKPKILPKPAGLSGSRTSLHSSPTSSTGGIGDMRGHLKRTVQSPRDTNQLQYVNGRSSVDEDADESGVVQESQGSVSSLAGMFGQSIRSKTPGQSRLLAGVVAAASVPATPPPPPPPQQFSSALSNGSAHRRTSSGIAAPIQPPPPPPSFQTPPLSQPSFNRANGAHPPQNVPMREGKWTFHNPSLFPPPPRGEIPQHKYPSGNRTGSSISFDM